MALPKNIAEAGHLWDFPEGDDVYCHYCGMSRRYFNELKKTGKTPSCRSDFAGKV